MTFPDGLPPSETLDVRVRELACSPTLAAKERAHGMAAEGRRVYRLGLGQSPFPVPDALILALIENASQREYLPVRGLLALRQAVAEYHRRRHGLARTCDEIIVGPGSKELMFLVQFCFSGELLVAAPAWVSYAPQARLCGRSVQFIQSSASEGYLIDPDTLDRVCRRSACARMLVLNYPSNPTGSTFSTAQLEGLARVCRRHGVTVLSDEIYGELRFDGQHRSIAPLYEEGTLVSGGLSKWCGAGGWRLGTFSFPSAMRWLSDAMAAMGSETYSTTSAPIQYAAVRAFALGDDMEDYLERARRVLCTLCSWARERLTQAGLSVPQPLGAFYLFPDFEPLRPRLERRGIHNDAQLVERLLVETGLSALAGSHFGMPAGSLHARLALVDFDGARALANADTELGGDFVPTYCDHVCRAIEALTSWLDGRRASDGSIRKGSTAAD
jgi:aspartate aminotransferase